MDNPILDDIQTLKWIISTLLSLIGVMGGFVCWYVLQLLREAKSHGQQIKRANEKITGLREYLNKHVSEILASEKSVGGELLKIRRTLVGTTVVLERRKSETRQIVADAERTRDRVEENTKRIREHDESIKAHTSELINLNNGFILVKGSPRKPES